MSYDSILQSLKGCSVLIRITYWSKLCLKAGEDGDTVIQEILKQSLRNNPKKQIGGMLYYNVDSQELVQVLEGPETAVRALYKVISEDPRHQDIVLILDAKVTERRYQEWGMLRGTPADWNLLKSELPGTVEWNRMPSFTLHEADTLPIAGDLDVELSRITYCSTIIAADTQESTKVMNEIIEKSHKCNQKKLIGGLIYFSIKTNEVFQCIEGPSNAIVSLFSAIEADPRHTGIKTILRETQVKRAFKSFGMLWAAESHNALVLENLPHTVVKELANRDVKF